MVLGENGHHYKDQFVMAFSKVIPLVHFRNLDSVDLKCPMVRLGKVMVAIIIVRLPCTFVSLRERWYLIPIDMEATKSLN